MPVSKAASEYPDGSVGRYVQERWGKTSGASDGPQHAAEPDPAEGTDEERSCPEVDAPPVAEVPRVAEVSRADADRPGPSSEPGPREAGSRPDSSAEAPGTWGSAIPDLPDEDLESEIDPVTPGHGIPGVRPGPASGDRHDVPGQDRPAARWGGTGSPTADRASSHRPTDGAGSDRAGADRASADRAGSDRASAARADADRVSGDRWRGDRTAPGAGETDRQTDAGMPPHLRAAPTHAGTDRDAAAARVAAARRAAEAARLASTRRPPASALPNGDTRTSRTFGGTTPDPTPTPTPPTPTPPTPTEPERTPTGTDTAADTRARAEAGAERVAAAARAAEVARSTADTRAAETRAADTRAAAAGTAAADRDPGTTPAPAASDTGDPARRGDDPAVDAAVARAIGRRTGTDGDTREAAADGHDQKAGDPAADDTAELGRSTHAQTSAAERAAAAWSTRSDEADRPADRPGARPTDPATPPTGTASTGTATTGTASTGTASTGTASTGTASNGTATPAPGSDKDAVASRDRTPENGARTAPPVTPAQTPAPGVPRPEPRRDDASARSGRRAAGEDMPDGAARRHPLTPPRGAAAPGPSTTTPAQRGQDTAGQNAAGQGTAGRVAAAGAAAAGAAAARTSTDTPPSGSRPVGTPPTGTPPTGTAPGGTRYTEPGNPDGQAGRRPGPQGPPRPDPRNGGSRVEQSWPPPPPPPSWPRPPREDNPRRPAGWTEPGAVAAQEAQRARTGQQVDLGGGDLSSARLLRPSKRPPQSGWRRAVYVLSGKLINPGESPLDIRRRELTARVNQPLLGCYKIAMLSLKGGVGKTTVTATLGATFASLRGDRVVAVDANPDRGTLSQKIPLETTATVRHLLRDTQRVRRYTDVRAYTSQGTSRLEVLASEQDPAVSEAFSEDDYRRTVNLLEHFYNIVLTDCGTGLMHSAMYGVLGMADQLIIVSSGSIDGARSASATMDWLDAHGHTDLVANAVAVINCVHRSSGGVDLDRVAEHFALRCRAVVRIPFDGHLEEGAEIDLDRLQPETRLALLELAASVADGFPS